MNQSIYLKVPCVWEEPLPIIEVPSRLKFQPVKVLSDEVLMEALAQVLNSSIDASDQKKVLELGVRRTAEQFLSESRDDFSYQDEWWQFGVNHQEQIVGFVLPVIYQGGTKDGLEEGTIYYIGVLPEYRGLGFSNDLLLKGTQILQDVGVWRIFCDTDVNNAPMISAFKRVGYRQYSEPWERSL